MSSEALEQALLYPKQSVELDPHHPEHHVRQRAGVRFPDENEVGSADIYPYGFAATSGELDDAVERPGPGVPEDAEAGADRKDPPS